MENVLRFVTGLIVLAAALAGVSYVFPGSYRVERSVSIGAPAEVVFARVADLKLWPEWAVWYERDPGLRTEYTAATSGVGAAMTWVGSDAHRGQLRITAAEAPRRLGYDLVFDESLRSSGEILIEPAGQGVRVSWSNGGHLGLNPINRWFGLFLDRLMGPDFAEGLARLKKASEAAAPKPVAAPAAPIGAPPRLPEPAPEVPASPPAGTGAETVTTPATPTASPAP